jgi:hypothetical protein
VVTAAVALAAVRDFLSGTAAVALLLAATALASYLATSFTGSTTFTSPSGVEKEMRRAIPLQLAVLLVAIALGVVVLVSRLEGSA